MPVKPYVYLYRLVSVKYVWATLRYVLCVTYCGRSDITFAVDWELTDNQLSFYLGWFGVGFGLASEAICTRILMQTRFR